MTTRLPSKHSGLARSRLQIQPRSSVGVALYAAEMTNMQHSKQHTRPPMMSAYTFEEQRGYQSSTHITVKVDSSLPSPSKTDSMAEVCSTTSSKAFSTGFHLDRATRWHSKKGGSSEACTHTNSLRSTLLCLQTGTGSCLHLQDRDLLPRDKGFLPRVRYVPAAPTATSSFGKYASC